MGKPGLSATDIGSKIGASGEEVNRLLKDQEFLYGKPGAYGLTSKGEEYGVQRSFDTGYGGVAYKDWEKTHFDPSILDMLDSSTESLSKVRADISADRQARRAEKEAAQAEDEANYQASQDAKEKANAEEERDAFITVVIAAGVVVLLVTVFSVKRSVESYKRKKAEKAAKANAAEDGSGASVEAEEK